MIKMVAFLMLWEFIMYNLHRLAHANRSLYRIAHAEHHVAMDFPLGPHTAFLEKLVNYAALVFVARVVDLSSGAFIFAINMLMCQCVAEHAYTSLTVPCIHTFLRFNTADEHEAHHKIVRGNYGYAFNWYDGLFGTVINEAKGRRTCTGRTEVSSITISCARTSTTKRDVINKFADIR
jgi:sterol desaturase/sphingolipid hydroxylase (fatty acid hydroxylase superfamily)